MPKDRHGKWLSRSLETSGICSIEFILHPSAFIRSQGGFLPGQNSVTIHSLTYHQGENIVANAIVCDSITSKRNTILYFLSKNFLGSTHIRTMLTIKVYKVFLVTVLLKLLIMIILYWYISQEKQLVKYFMFTFQFFARCLYKLLYGSFRLLQNDYWNHFHVHVCLILLHLIFILITHQYSKLVHVTNKHVQD